MSQAVRHSPLRRLRTMDAAEIRFRASVALRNALDRARVSVAPPVWDRHGLRVVGPGVEPARVLLARGDWLGAHRALAKHFKNRPPLFPLSPERAALVARGVRSSFPMVDACTRADRVIAGRHDLLGYTNVDVGSPPDWHRDPVHDRRAPLLFWNAVPYLDPACGDHKITWELNRHQHFLVLGRAFHLTGDEKYLPRVRASTHVLDRGESAAAGHQLDQHAGARVARRVVALGAAFLRGSRRGNRRPPVACRSLARVGSPTGARRAQPFTLLQPQHPSVGRSPRALCRGTRATGAGGREGSCHGGAVDPGR